jgi:uncharacterized sporulation protein YeaH/YhbH (DUF444 family)
MTVVFIDRRKLRQDRNLENRRRFFQRVKSQLLDSIQDLSDHKIHEVDKTKRKVSLDQEKIEEPHFAYAATGIWEFVLSGNSNLLSNGYVVGDEIEKPEESQGGRGSDPSEDGEGNDDFLFEVNEDEFLQLFFEDLELPNMVNKTIAKTDVYTWQRKGYTSSGAPANLELRKTFRNSLGRRIALGRPHVDDIEEKKEDETDEQYQERIAHWKRIPYIDPVDVRYRNFVKQPVPTFSAVIFFMMDVSGSMTEHHKDLAKRFFMLYYFFLQKKYLNVEIVFVSHTHVAKEVDEQEFFYSTDSGGTHVMPALKLISKIQQDRYPIDKWNIYMGQASDGDCFSQDGVASAEYMMETLLPIMQYACYINVFDGGRNNVTPLMEAYSRISNENFDQVKVKDKKDIFPVFRKLFSKNREEAKTV